MSVTAAAGILGFGPQAAMGSDAETWYRHRAVSVDLGVNDPTQVGQSEVGGIAVPTFPYKTGPVVGGGFTIQPRLENTLGWLLYGMMGKCESAETPGGSGIYDHKFTLADESTTVPWMGFRKVIPKRNGEAGTDLGEQYNDCKIVGCTLVLPSSEPITARFDVLGREFIESNDPNGDYTWANDYEHWESIPVGCVTNGYIKLDGQELPIVAAQLGWQNVPQDLRQARVFGSPFIDDVTVVQRRLTVDITVLWNNPDLYQQALTGQTNGTAWSPAPFTTSLDILTLGTVNMDNESEPFSLRVESDEIMLGMAGGIQLAGNEAIMLRFQGVALEGTNYCRFTLRNKQSTYSWPVVSSGS